MKQFGGSPDEDTRTAVATVLLEHLIERAGPRALVRAHELVVRSSRFADTLKMCWDFTDNPNQSGFDRAGNGTQRENAE